MSLKGLANFQEVDLWYVNLARIKQFTTPHGYYYFSLKYNIGSERFNHAVAYFNGAPMRPFSILKKVNCEIAVQAEHL